MTFKVIRGQGQAEEMTSVPYWDYFYYICQVNGVKLADIMFSRLCVCVYAHSVPLV